MACNLKLVLLLVILPMSTAGVDFRDAATLLEKPDFLQLIHDYYKPDLVDLIKRLNLNVFFDYAAKAGIVEELKSEGPFTVAAPTSSSFNTAPLWEKTALKNKTFLTQAMSFHVLMNTVTSYNAFNEMLVPTLANIDARFNVYTNKVVTIQCSPIDQQRRDKMASNGVLHVVTGVLLPPYGTIVDALSACPAFTTLVRALEFTGLVDLLHGDGPFTIFAPTDSAFASLAQQTRQYLFSHQAIFADVLLHHVVNGTYCSASFSRSATLDTLDGEQLTISLTTTGVITVDSATVVPGGADGSVTNGVVHGIDAVLLPF